MMPGLRNALIQRHRAAELAVCDPRLLALLVLPTFHAKIGFFLRCAIADFIRRCASFQAFDVAEMI